jgi:hypothetical protein
MSIRTQQLPTFTELEAAETRAETAADEAAQSVVDAQAIVDGAGISKYSFKLLDTAGPIPGLNSVTAADGESGTVWGDTDELNGVYSWQSAAWVRIADNPKQDIAQITSRFKPDMPLGADAEDGTLVLMNEGGWILSRLTTAAMSGLMQNIDWLNEAPTRFVPSMPTGGHFVGIQEDGWLLTDYDAPTAAATTVEATITDGQVAAVLTDQVEDQPLLVGQNIFLTVGESKANSINFKANAFDQICTQMGTPKPAGATVADAVYFHNAYTIAEIVAAWADVKAIIDTAFSGGAECISMLSFVEMANDMGAGGTTTSAEDWETQILALQDLVNGYCMQKYVGTAPTAIMPVPPAAIVVDCTWPDGGLLPDIPLRAIDMARRIYNFGVAVPDYIATMYDDRHYGEPGNPGNTAAITLERNRISAYLGLYDYWWRILKRKYNPTQVIDAWFDGSDAFLRMHAPHFPLVADTALVSTIANYGLEAHTALGASITISSTSIVGNGQIVKVTRSGSWSVGEQIWGAITGTTTGKSGRIDGPRSTLRDSSPYQVDLGAGLVHLYSPLMPFKRSLLRGI